MTISFPTEVPINLVKKYSQILKKLYKKYRNLKNGQNSIFKI